MPPPLFSTRVSDFEFLTSVSFAIVLTEAVASTDVLRQDTELVRRRTRLRLMIPNVGFDVYGRRRRGIGLTGPDPSLFQ